jgi:cyclopropane fatty-acyl-phospholipid synthase-like methyltransferase
MERDKFTTIAHHDHVYCNPISAEKMDRMIGLLGLTAGQRVLDIGCGKGELLIRLIEMYGVHAVGVDTNTEFVREARSRAAARIPGAKREFHRMDFATFPVADESFDLSACVGSSHACGGLRKALCTLARAVRPGGYVLMGEGYWRREPNDDYLAALGTTRDELTSHAGNVRLGIENGLTPMYVVASNQDEWDHYEWMYGLSVERHLKAHPEDPDRDAMAERIREWRRHYMESGRDTLGFGLYLFAKETRH